MTNMPDDHRLLISRQSPAPWERPPGLPEGWSDVPAVTLGACEARAVRWVGAPHAWGRPVLQFERAVTADHVWLHMVTVPGAASEDEVSAAIAGGGEAGALNLADLTALRTMLSRLIRDLESGR